MMFWRNNIPHLLWDIGVISIFLIPLSVAFGLAIWDHGPYFPINPPSAEIKQALSNENFYFKLGNRTYYSQGVQAKASDEEGISPQIYIDLNSLDCRGAYLPDGKCATSTDKRFEFDLIRREGLFTEFYIKGYDTKTQQYFRLTTLYRAIYSE